MNPPSNNHVANGDNHVREKQLARRARLRYVSDAQPGYARRRAGNGFFYLDVAGKRVADEGEIERIKSLVIPPAWQDVWICQWPNGHLQSTGRDDLDRKQYLYHPRWREASENHKFHRLAEFGEQLPRIRRKVSRDLAKEEWSPERLAALAVRLLDRAAMRVGSREYTRDNETYGLTTLTSRHLRITDSKLEFHFIGKGNKPQHYKLRDRRLAKLLSDLKTQRTEILLGYREGKREVKASAAMINDYLQEFTGLEITAKDFRTWKASVIATSCLWDCEEIVPPEKVLFKKAVELAAESLGNTVAICRKHYIHPQLLESDASDEIAAVMKKFRPQKRRQLRIPEQRLLHLLQESS